METKLKIKNMLRPWKNILFSLFGFMYDFFRFYRYAGWRNSKDFRIRDYKAVKIYHRLEKSLSFSTRNKTSGWGAAEDFVSALKQSGFDPSSPLYHEAVGLKVLQNFVSDHAHGVDKRHNSIIEFAKAYAFACANQGGVLSYSASKIERGRLESPEDFFNSRYSVRSYKDESVPKELVFRALNLALKTPSVCNRQAWHVYHVDNRDTIDKTLALQNGNRGFGHEVPCLLIIATDLKAFDASSERYQHWIDGGMFSMSIVLALHSLGLSSCCLNWSKDPLGDIKFRRLIDIEGSHNVIMMLAVGYAKDDFNVCVSARKPIESIYTYLQ